MACNFIKTVALAQVFSYEFCEISENTFFYRTPLVDASAHQNVHIVKQQLNYDNMKKL